MGGHRPGWLSAGVSWATVLYLILPITVILPVSLTDQRFLSLPYETLSVQHYARLLTTPAWTMPMPTAPAA